jgi:hypothetical protein
MGSESGRDFLALVDEPMSTLIVGLAWHYNWPLIPLFGIIGTLWWYFVSKVVLFLYAKIHGSRELTR